MSPFGHRAFTLGVMFFLCVSRLNVYSVLVSGWASNSKYALLGSIRAVAQTISYEVRIALVVTSVLVLCASIRLESIARAQQPVWLC